MNYFAYGSNMAPARLGARVPSARPLGIYELPGHKLRFHKIGRDGSAKCDAFFTGRPTDLVQGIAFSLDRAELPFLDAAEDLGTGYERRTVRVSGREIGSISAFAYFALQIDAGLRPFTWYKHHVLAGARSAGLKPGYIRNIERVEATEDPDQDRERRELAVHVHSSEAGWTRRP